jgi:cell division protein FtsZ
MTLFEVDEAASRVREEVDSDANIIFGATFDERLEGTIRVSVVATGIDAAAEAAETLEDLPPQEQMVELTKRLKTVGQAGAGNPQQMRAAGQRNTTDALEDELAVPRLSGMGDGAPAQRRSSADPGVRIGPFRPDPSLVAAQREPDGDMDALIAGDIADGPSGPYIPPEAERPADDGPRMPNVEDFPAIAQRQMANAGRPAAMEEEHRPRGLLARLAHGLSKREDEDEDTTMRAGSAQRPIRMEVEPRIATPADRVAAPQPRRIGEAPNPSGTLDPHGRVTAGDSIQDEDALEIPAFLRRQSS